MDENLKIRRTKALDREAVFQFTKDTWGGYDFIPEVWNQWMKDRMGIFLTALHEGRPVGINKVTFLSPGEAWLEGLRVDPKYRGMGIARALTKRSIREARHRDAKVIRLSTGSTNRISREIAESFEFKFLGAFEHYSARTLPTESYFYQIRKNSIEEILHVWDLLSNSKMYVWTHGLYANGWTFPKLDPWAFQNLLIKSQVYRTRSPKWVQSVCIITRSRVDGSPCIAFSACRETEYLDREFQDLRRLAGSLGFKKIWMVLPKKKDLREAALKGGFQLSYHRLHIHVFEWINPFHRIFG